jgi:hypothetical protein
VTKQHFPAPRGEITSTDLATRETSENSEQIKNSLENNGFREIDYVFKG